MGVIVAVVIKVVLEKAHAYPGRLVGLVIGIYQVVDCSNIRRFHYKSVACTASEKVRKRKRIDFFMTNGFS